MKQLRGKLCGSWGKNTGVVCHSLLQWATFGENSPPWPVRLGWLCPAWFIASMSYTRLWSTWSFWLAFCDCGFHSVDCGIVVLASSICPLMGQDKRLVQTSWWEGLTVGKTGSRGPWCWERLKAGEGYDRGRDGLMASLTRWTWVWASSGRWWRTAKPGILQSMGSQRVRRLSNRQQIMWYWLCVQFVIKVKN